MSAEEKQLLDVRIQLAQAVRQHRELNNISQVELALKLKTSQPRIAMIERGAKNVSLDQLFKAATAVGATIKLLVDTSQMKIKGVNRKVSKMKMTSK